MDQLPIQQYKDQILKLVDEQKIFIVVGQPGCGKSTQLPQFLLQTQFYPVCITQPRVVAAIAMARRVSFERKSRLGQEVGYSVRFDECTSSRTLIKYATDGILVREAMQDRLLSRYKAIILDEIHERSLDTDILLALVKDIIKKRQDFRVIITTATLDQQLFQSYLPDISLLEIQGQQFDVETLHSQIKSSQRVDASVNASIRIHLHEGPGDILVFLTGSEECEIGRQQCYDKLEKLLAQGKHVPSMLILTLYGAMQQEDQHKVFKPAPRNTRKVIFSTNIAETSLTVDGVVYVVDCGYVKQKQYNPRTGIEALVTVPISKQQAIQRRGRAGRTQPGKCFRLYSESFYENQMTESIQPEIKTCNLNQMLLQLKSLGVQNVFEFDLIEKPDYEAIIVALRHLAMIGAIDFEGNLTQIGRQLVKLPLEPAFGRCLLTSIELKCSSDMLILLSVLSSERIWAFISKKDTDLYQEFREYQQKFMSEYGDHQTYIDIFKLWKENLYHEEWCFDNFLNFRALRFARNIRQQLRSLVQKVKVPHLPEQRIIKKLQQKGKLFQVQEKLRFSLTSGFFMNSARAIASSTPGTYISAVDGSIKHLDSGSSLSLMQIFPNWLVYTSLQGATLNFGTMRDCSCIEGKWAKHFLPIIGEIQDSQLLDGLPIKRQRSEQIEVQENKEEKVNKARERFLKRRRNVT